MSVLVDTNILLRRTQLAHTLHPIAMKSVARLLASGEPVYFTPQNIAEFWNVATRPLANNGLGFPVSLVLVEVEKIERILTLLPDAPAIYAEWKRLVVKHSVQGVKVHDTRLVAAMAVHGIGRILTFNADDFNRYDVEVLDPAVIGARDSARSRGNHVRSLSQESASRILDQKLKSQRRLRGRARLAIVEIGLRS
jgi:predicted nucleic acid-binding protein